MTDEQNPTETVDENAQNETAEDEAWTPPASLPAPSAVTSRVPIEAVLAAMGVSLACGVGLWASGQVFYVYIFYNVLVGSAVGWALALAPRKAGFTNMPALMGLAVIFGALPYVLMRLGFFVQLLPELQAQGFDPSFPQFFMIFLENDDFFGLEVGVIGNAIVLLAEVGITLYYAYAKLVEGMAQSRIASMPNEVLSFVVSGLADGWDTDKVRQELSSRGWTQPADQDRAIGTGFDLIAAMQAQKTE